MVQEPTINLRHKFLTLAVLFEALWTLQASSCGLWLKALGFLENKPKEEF